MRKLSLGREGSFTGKKKPMTMMILKIRDTLILRNPEVNSTNGSQKSKQRSTSNVNSNVF